MFFNNLIVIPYKNYKENKENNKLKEILKKEFKKNFGVDADTVRLIMSKSEVLGNFLFHNKETTKMSNEEYDKFLKEQLLINSREINELSQKPVFFYEPEIIEIHNENLYGKIGPSIKQLKAEETKKDEASLSHQFTKRLKSVKNT
jgi:hypothetical protein